MTDSKSRSLACRVAAGLALLAALTACGGGGSSGFLPTAAAGLYEVTGGSTPAFEVIVLDTGRLYAIYGLNAGTPVPAGGVIAGDITTTGSTFNASTVHDFNLASHTVSSGTASGSFTAKTSISGTATTSVATSPFSGTYSATYDEAASLAALAGSYGGETADLGGTKVSVVTVNAAGLIAGSSSSGCAYAGVATPHARGNVFDVTMTYQSGCTEDGNTLRGHAFVSHNVLYIVTLNGDQSHAVVFAGVKS